MHALKAGVKQLACNCKSSLRAEHNGQSLSQRTLRQRVGRVMLFPARPASALRGAAPAREEEQAHLGMKTCQHLAAKYVPVVLVEWKRATCRMYD